MYIYGAILYYFSSRGVRNDASLVPPIRQTASIFKQPVTIYKTQEGKVKDIKHGNQEKPKQVTIISSYFHTALDSRTVETNFIHISYSQFSVSK